MKPIILGDAKNISKNEWLDWRMNGPLGNIPYTLGGSDISSVFGLNPWKSAIELWHTKRKHRISYSKERNSWMSEAGNIYEPYVIDVFNKHMLNKGHKCEIINDSYLYQCGDFIKEKDGRFATDEAGNLILKYPYALANIDRLGLIDDELCVIEAKITSSFNYEIIENWKSGIVPIYYELQVRYYLKILDLKTAYICCTWGFGPKDFVVVRIDRDENVEQVIMQTCDKFIQYLYNNKEPNLVADQAGIIYDFYSRLYEPKKDEEIIVIPQCFAENIKTIKEKDEEIQLLKEQIKICEEERLAAFNPLFHLFEKNDKGNYIFSDGSRMKITLSIGKEKDFFDILKLEQKYPNLYRKSCEPTKAEFLRIIQSNISDLKKQKRAAKNNKPLVEKLDRQINEFESIVKEIIVPGEYNGTRDLKTSFVQCRK